MRAYLQDKMGFWDTVPVTEEQEQRLAGLFNEYFNHDNTGFHKTLYNSFDRFTEEVYGIMDSLTGLGFTTNGHSGTLVPVYAIGAGAEEFIPLNDNTDIPARIRRIAGLTE